MKKNDILTPIGLVLAIGFIFFAIAQGKGGVGMFIDIPSFLITVGGSFAAVLITFDLDTVKRIPSALKMSIVSPSVNNSKRGFKGRRCICKHGSWNCWNRN